MSQISSNHHVPPPPLQHQSGSEQESHRDDAQFLDEVTRQMVYRHCTLQIRCYGHHRVFGPGDHFQSTLVISAVSVYTRTVQDQCPSEQI